MRKNRKGGGGGGGEGGRENNKGKGKICTNIIENCG